MRKSRKKMRRMVLQKTTLQKMSNDCQLLIYKICSFKLINSKLINFN